MAELLRDIYARNDEISSYRDDQIEIHDPLLELVQKLEHTLLTNKGEVLGEPDFGCDLEKLVFSLGENEAKITNKILAQIRTYCLTPGYKIEVLVRFFEDQVQYVDGCIIEIRINDNKAIGIVI